MLPSSSSFIGLVLVSLLGGVSAQSSSSAAHSSGSVGGSSSGPSSVGTPTNSAALPNLSGVSTCVTTCLAMAASAAGCASEVAVDCFCVNPRPYTASLLACLGPCPDQLLTAEGLVQQFCAAAAAPTSLSFGSFTPSPSASSSSASASASGSRNGTAAATSGSATAPSTSPSAPPNGAVTMGGWGSAGVALLVGSALAMVAM
ncbi:hypothetical protein C8R43DRAFT_498087 [Mycena crocata]|nr:hypothetical protein C8R43DRAFT_498087 [Mycena crocata]